MKRISLYFIAIAFVVASFINKSDSLQDNKIVHAFWVEFQDKAGTPYTVDNPIEFLSQKAIERRKKNGVAITEQDLPITPVYIEHVKSVKGVDVFGQSRWFNAVMVLVEDEKDIVEVQRLWSVKNTTYLGSTNIANFSRGDASQTITLMENFQDDGNNDVSNNTDKYSKEYYGEGFRQIELLNGVKMHKMTYTGKDVHVGIIDAGFYKANDLSTFSKLYKDGRIVETWDFMERNEEVYEDNNHGMAVLSCMGAETPGGMVGTSPDASFHLYRTENVNFELPIEQVCWVFAIEKADIEGCDVINSSLGYYDFDTDFFDIPYERLDGKSSIITQAAEIGASKGMVLCISAGNEGSSRWEKIAVPADANGILAVGAVDKDERKAGFSSYGPTADGRVMPNVMSMGRKATVASSSNTFYPSDGTSFASPILCGMVACLVQANPNAKSADIVDAVVKSSDMYPLHSDGLGYGIPDFYTAHVMLGNAEDFDYTKTQLVEVNIGKDYAVYNVYSPVKQDVVLHITRNGKEVFNNALVLGEKSFTKNAIDDNKILTKGGNFIYTIKTSDGKVIASKEFTN